MPFPKSSHLVRAALCAAALTLTASAIATPPGHVPERPSPGVLLVAKPRIDGGPFWHSVVLILSHGDEGTLGLIINRATEIPLARALPDLKAEDAEGRELQFGGPVDLDGLLYLFSAEEPPTGAQKVMANVYFAGDEALLEALLKKKESESHLKLYLGHAGWSKGQLDMELARGDWELATADLFTLLQKEPQTIWPALSRSGNLVARRGMGSISRDSGARLDRAPTPAPARRGEREPSLRARSGER